MDRPDSPRGGSVPAAPANGLRRLLRHIRSQVTSYDSEAARVKQPLRVHYPNLSPTRPPATEADAAFWPSWTDAPVEDLDLDHFDDSGVPLCPKTWGVS